MKKTLLIISIAVIGLTGCQQFKKGDGGMLYKIHTDKSGPNVKEGDFVALWVVQKTENDSVAFSSYEYDRTAFVQIQKSAYPGDIFSAFNLLSEGDSATFKMNIDSMEAALTRQGAQKPPRPKGNYWIYTFAIKKVIPKGTLSDSAFSATIQTFMKSESELAKNSETAKINRFIASKGYTPQTTASGLKYVVTKQGSGPKANLGDTVEVNYTVSLLTGKVFDSSIPEIAKNSASYSPQRPYASLKTPTGQGASIAGFEEALLLFPKGTKVTLILPSKLAYGEQGSQQMAPFTPITFDIEVLNILPPKQAALPPAPVTPAKK